MSSPQPWQPGAPGLSGAAASHHPAPAPPPPSGGRRARAAVPWLIGVGLLLVVSLVLSLTTDGRSLQDVAGLPDSIGDWDGAGSATDDAGGADHPEQHDEDGAAGGDGEDDSARNGGGTEQHDEQLEAFHNVAAGDCLENYDTGDGWNAAVPVAGECETDRGVMFVSSVQNSAEECDTGPGLGFWAHSTDAGETVALCLIRQFHEEQCILAEEGEAGIEDANLLSAVECDADDLPAHWNHIVRITAVYQAPDEMYDGACARYEGDQQSYYYWMVDREQVLVCGESYPS